MVRLWRLEINRDMLRRPARFQTPRSSIAGLGERRLACRRNLG